MLLLLFDLNFFDLKLTPTLFTYVTFVQEDILTVTIFYICFMTQMIKLMPSFGPLKQNTTKQVRKTEVLQLPSEKECPALIFYRFPQVKAG